jgi:hypothetical protein
MSQQKATDVPATDQAKAATVQPSLATAMAATSKPTESLESVKEYQEKRRKAEGCSYW